MKVLIVEDDQFYAQRIAELLQDRLVDTILACSAEEAIAVDLTNVDGAIIDLMLPNDVAASGISMQESRGGFLTGVAVARRFLQRKPKLRIVMMSSDFGSEELHTWTAENNVTFVPKNEGYHTLTQTLKRLGLVPGELAPLSFIVHGHDNDAVMELKNYIQNTLKWQEPVILREQQSAGKTIIEKFEKQARRIDCVFVLLTPDDASVETPGLQQKRRSRQNVIFELGFFYGTMDRKSGRILLLHKGPNELPSDMSGIVWIDITNGISAAGEEIRKEVASLSADRKP